MIFLCGRAANGAGVPDIEGQTVEVRASIDRLLGEVASDRSRILLAKVHLKAIDDFAMMNRISEAWLVSAPARTIVDATLASPELLVEMW